MSELLVPPPLTFEQQYKNVRKVDSYGGTATYVDLDPGFTDGNLPILVASGWSEGRKSFHDTGKELFDRKRRALIVDHARRGDVPELESKFVDEILHKANTLISVMDDAGVDRADVIAHSEGAINVVVAALQNPERFNSIILAMPAGMIGKDSVLRLAGRFAPKVARSITKDTYENPGTGLAINVSGLAYVAKNPAKAYREVDAMASTTINDVLRTLREHGIKIGILQSHDDTVFPADRIEDNVILEGPFTNADSYSSVIAEDAGHDDLLIHPERSTNAALRIIDQFS